ncbi:MAG: DNA-3-methyladenine glycosylase [Bacteroidetes bacterium]|nr:MAG: DNA-3-methyladenine glycosylase [Bacteroidota bacterium]
MPAFSPSLLSGTTLRTARHLLGKTLVCRTRSGTLSGIIVETEAYLRNDPASHSFRGRTRRNDVMFGPPGRLYVYFTYGMHHCINVVTQREGIGEAVLIRAVEPSRGVAVMKRRRGWNRGMPVESLTNGPAKLAQAFGLTLAQNGADLRRGHVTIEEGVPVPDRLVGRSGRIGIRVATEKRWRFYVQGNPFVSRT